jgi:YidC/Oxa1 family membrane protein insertase
LNPFDLIAAGFLGIEHFTPPWDAVFLPLFNLVVLLYRVLFSDFALAIIVSTVLIRTVLAPLFVQQIRSQREMQQVQPLVREIQRKHKGNRQKIQEETMALYREHGVNPFGGCLPLALQLPILLALYSVLQRASGIIQLAPDQVASDAFETLQSALDITAAPGERMFQVPVSGECNLTEFSQLPQLLPLNCQLLEPFKLGGPVDTTIGWLGGLDLALIDHVFSVPIFAGFVISALAVIAAVLQFVQVKMTSPRPNPDDPTAAMTNTMVYTFPLLTIMWGGFLPSGLILYWIAYTTYLIVQQYLIMGTGNLFPLFGWQPGGWRRREADAPAAEPSVQVEAPQPGNPRPAQVPARGSTNPASRPQGAKKRRGRRR